MDWLKVAEVAITALDLHEAKHQDCTCESYEVDENCWYNKTNEQREEAIKAYVAIALQTSFS